MVWRVGQKVVCIEDFSRSTLIDPRTIAPTVGTVYRIRAIRPDALLCTGIFFLLAEIKNPQVVTGVGYIEQAFSSKGFRPAVDRKTDISIFQRILDDAGGNKINKVIVNKVGKIGLPTKIYIGDKVTTGDDKFEFVRFLDLADAHTEASRRMKLYQVRRWAWQAWLR